MDILIDLKILYKKLVKVEIFLFLEDNLKKSTFKKKYWPIKFYLFLVKIFTTFIFLQN